MEQESCLNLLSSVVQQAPSGMRVLNLEVILGPLLQLTLQLHLRRITREGIPGGAAGPLRYEGVKPEGIPISWS